MTRHRDRVAIVVGAETSLLRAIAVSLVEGGAAVAVLVHRRSDDEAGRQVLDGTSRALQITVDVTRLDDLSRAVTQVVEFFGRLDVAVNCMFMDEGKGCPLMSLPESDWCASIDAALTGTFLAIKCEAAAILSTVSRGAIVNVGPILGLFGRVGEVAHTTAMHGVLGLTKVASAELGRQGLRVNAVCTGDVYATTEESPGCGSSTHLGRNARPQEIAALVRWLSSDEASYVTGSVHTIDGGATSTL